MPTRAHTRTLLKRPRLTPVGDLPFIFHILANRVNKGNISYYKTYFKAKPYKILHHKYFCNILVVKT